VIVRRWQEATGGQAVLEVNGLPFADVAAKRVAETSVGNQAPEGPAHPSPDLEEQPA
jgi:hypothetical protein